MTLYTVKLFHIKKKNYIQISKIQFCEICKLYLLTSYIILRPLQIIFIDLLLLRLLHYIKTSTNYIY